MPDNKSKKYDFSNISDDMLHKVLVVFAVIVVFVLSIKWMDSDGTWLIATGREIIKNGIPRTNPFTMVEGLDIVIQQWLYAVVLAFIYDTFGNIGMFLLLLLMESAVAFFAYKLLSVLGAKPVVKTFGVIIISMNLYYHNIRPELLTIVLLLLQLFLVEKYEITKKKIYLWLIPLVVLAEANFHAAMGIMHFIVMAPYFVPSFKPLSLFVKNNAVDYKPYIAPGIASFIALFINPYAVQNVTYVFVSMGSIDQLNIQEISPFGSNSIVMLWYLVVFTTFVFLVYKKSISSTAFYMSVEFLLFSVFHIRNVIFLSIAALYLISSIQCEISRIVKYMLVGIGYIALVLIISKDCIYHDEYNVNAQFGEIVEYLDEHVEDKSSCKIYTSFNDGGPLEFYGYKCFMDSRPELYMECINNKFDVIYEIPYRNLKPLISNDGHYVESKSIVEPLLKKYDFDYMILSDNTRMDMLLIPYVEEKYEPVVVPKNSHKILYKKR